jgi:hypothetical protein
MSICLRRREFIAGLGGAAAWPLATQAQQRVLPVVAYVSVVSAEAATEREVCVPTRFGRSRLQLGAERNRRVS